MKDHEQRESEFYYNKFILIANNQTLMVKDYFYHESNIIGKCRDVKGNAYRRICHEMASFKESCYDPYKIEQLKITGISREDISKKVALLNAYYPLADQFNEQYKITSQAKFRPTILEEFCGFLLKDIPAIESLGLDFFNKAVFAGITLDKEGYAIIKTKNIDFCIGKEFNVDIEGDTRSLVIPVIAIECKTYLDKTMFSEAQFTAQKMKQGSPNVRVYVVAEENQVDKNEIPTKGRTPVDQIYIIRGNPKNPISETSADELFSDIKSDLEHLTVDAKINEIGRMIVD